MNYKITLLKIIIFLNLLLAALAVPAYSQLQGNVFQNAQPAGAVYQGKIEQQQANQSVSTSPLQGLVPYFGSSGVVQSQQYPPFSQIFPRQATLTPETPYFGTQPTINLQPTAQDNKQSSSAPKVWKLCPYEHDVGQEFNGYTEYYKPDQLMPARLPAKVRLRLGFSLDLKDQSNQHLVTEWRSWYLNFMHMFYCNLLHFPGGAMEDVNIFVNRDGAVVVNRVFPVENQTFQAIDIAARSLQGLPQLRFPPGTCMETISIVAKAGVVDAPPIPTDAFGRPIAFYANNYGKGWRW